MNHLDTFDEYTGVIESPVSGVLLPVVLGLTVNLAALAIGDPYQMAGIGLVAALVATFTWRRRPLAWVIFVACLAANPANDTTPIAMNIYCAAVYFFLMRGSGWKKVPRLVQIAFFLITLSIVISIIASLWATLTVQTIHTTDVSQPGAWRFTWAGGASLEVLLSQVAPVVNYLFGPFLFIPIIFSRINSTHDSELLLKGLVYGLILPTLLLFLLTRVYGRPVIDADALSQNLLNVATFHLGKLDIQMIRTQVGIVLAALICASFAVAISEADRSTRIAGFGCLAVAAYFLLVTGSVGSTIAALAGILLIFILGKRQYSIKRYVVLLSVGVSLSFAAWFILPQGIQRYAESRYEVRMSKSGSATSDRSWRWEKSFDYLMENPSGVGWSLFIEPLGIYPHNDYLTYAIAFGLVSGIVYFIYVIGMLFSFFIVNPISLDPARFAFSLIGVGVATVVFINSLSDHMTSNRWYFNVVWSLIWFSFFSCRVDERPSESNTP